MVVGLKVTLIVQLAPGVTVMSQVCVWVNGPVTAMLLTVRTPRPVFLSVTTLAGSEHHLGGKSEARGRERHCGTHPHTGERDPLWAVRCVVGDADCGRSCAGSGRFESHGDVATAACRDGCATVVRLSKIPRVSSGNADGLDNKRDIAGVLQGGNPPSAGSAYRLIAEIEARGRKYCNRSPQRSGLIQVTYWPRSLRPHCNPP